MRRADFARKTSTKPPRLVDRFARLSVVEAYHLASAAYYRRDSQRRGGLHFYDMKVVPIPHRRPLPDNIRSLCDAWHASMIRSRCRRHRSSDARRQGAMACLNIRSDFLFTAFNAVGPKTNGVLNSR
jgi:hypothetical protein